MLVAVAFLDFVSSSSSDDLSKQLTLMTFTSISGCCFVVAYFFVFGRRLLAYFSCQAKKYLPVHDFEKIKVESKVFTKVSSTYFNSDKEEIKKAIVKRRMIDHFIEDLNKEAELPNTPSMNVHRHQLEKPMNATRKSSRVLSTSMHKMTRLQSMHDILKQANGVPDSQACLVQEIPQRRKDSVNSRRNTLSLAKSPVMSASTEDKDTPMGSINSGANTRKNNDSATKSSFSDMYLNRVKLVTQAKETIVSKMKQANSDCSICLVRPSEALFEPCNHGGICLECAIKCFSQEVRQCPICRQVLSVDADHRSDS